MSQRTLLEFNHDQAHKIEKDPMPFLLALGELMRGGRSDDTLLVLGSYGVKWHGQRHHSDAFDIKWGGHVATETQS